MPRTSDNTSATALQVATLAPETQDKAERKRVLNVLAQRRYRQRQKQKLSQLPPPRYLGPRDTPSSRETPTSWDVTLPGNSLSSISGEENGAVVCDPSDDFTECDALICSPSGCSAEVLDPCQDGARSALVPGDLFDAYTYLGEELGVDQDSSNSTTDAPSTTSPWHPHNFTTTDFNPFPDKDPSQELSNWLQSDDCTHTTFGDDRTLELPLLNLLNAAQILATHLHSLDRLFDLSALSIFYRAHPFQLPWTTSLPANLQPVSAQFALPHHPLLDLIPWPSVRTKLICVFSMPPTAMALRDPKDGTLLDFERFVYDVDEGGLLVAGHEPAETGNWELGDQGFVRRWWWAFDKEVLKATNRKRRARGEEVLSIGGVGGG